ncbi:uncharacterized protein LOC135395372 [Ornithodoros turicata]|uniref:uncharacterized protein LOC135395372 n=1 Tax=Ornithodoros turicata TaxID=34597 RepID=UPI0031388C31
MVLALKRGSLLLAVLSLIAGVSSAYFPKEDDYREPPQQQQQQQQDFAGQDLTGFLLPFKEAPVSRYDETPLNFIKRGVMMGVDLPDFILNRNHAGNKHLQALRQRLFESGRRR